MKISGFPRWPVLTTATALIFSAPGASSAEMPTIAQGNDLLSLDPANHDNNSTESALLNLYD